MTPRSDSDALIIAHFEFARAISRRFAARRKLPESDVESEAMVALCESARAFDASMGQPFRQHARVNITHRLSQWASRQRKAHGDDVPLEDADGPVTGHGRRVEDSVDGDRVSSLVGTLGLRDATIIRWHFGLDGCEPRSMREIARHFRVNPSAVSRRIARLLATLRKRSTRCDK